MKPIPLKLRADIQADPWMTRCCLAKFSWHTCGGRIEWEHRWLYKGERIQEAWAILPLCHDGHELKTRGTGAQKTKDALAVISLSRATSDDLAKYPKMDWSNEKRKLGMM